MNYVEQVGYGMYALPDQTRAKGIHTYYGTAPPAG